MNQQLYLENVTLESLTISQARQLLNKEVYTIEKNQDGYTIKDNTRYEFNSGVVYPYKRIKCDGDNNIISCDEISEKSFLENIKKDLEGAITLPKSQLSNVCDVANNKYFDIEKEDLVKIIGDSYEVAFVVYGSISFIDESIGDIECNGVIEEEDGDFHLKDGRAYFVVQANSPEEAYVKASELFENMDVGECQIYDSKLEHICLNGDDQYWSLSDLDIDDNLDR